MKTFPIVDKADNAEIYVYDTIGESWAGQGVSANAFRKQLAEVKAKKLTVRINSPGGDPFDAMAMHTLLTERGNVTVKIDGLAASAASIVAMAGNTIEMAETGLLMIHDALGVTVGNAQDHLEFAAVLEKVDGQIAAAYAKKTGRGPDELRKLMDAETWMTADEAKELGFIDAISEKEETQAHFRPERIAALAPWKNAPNNWLAACGVQQQCDKHASQILTLKRRAAELYNYR